MPLLLPLFLRSLSDVPCHVRGVLRCSLEKDQNKKSDKVSLPYQLRFPLPKAFVAFDPRFEHFIWEICPTCTYPRTRSFYGDYNSSLV